MVERRKKEGANRSEGDNTPLIFKELKSPGASGHEMPSGGHVRSDRQGGRGKFDEASEAKRAGSDSLKVHRENTFDGKHILSIAWRRRRRAWGLACAY
jgi:hypothetical protein